MRLRNDPKAKDYLQKAPSVIHCPFNNKGQWGLSFCSNNPIYLEIGCGKGQFIAQLSEENSQENFIGMELYPTVLYKALLKFQRQTGVADRSNLLWINEDARELENIFAPGEITGIYLNFSDPWPKKRHASRRLTSPNFLEKYALILADNGRIEFKTDNRDLFDYSLETIKTSSLFSLEQYTKDLHHDAIMMKHNIMTEYEERFSSLGHPIYKYIAKKQSSN